MSDLSWRQVSSWLVLALLVVWTTGCDVETPPPAGEERASEFPSESAPRAGPSYREDTPRLVVLGDSLAAGLGVAPSEAYPAVLQTKLEEAGLVLEVVNAGVSGDTSAGGLRRLEWSLEGDVRILVVALGGNDGLRGLPVEELRNNLRQIITTAVEQGIAVLLAGMEAPPNFGSAYTNAFRSVYDELAQGHDVVFVPFLLEGVAGVPDLNQSDGIHPNARGAERVAEHLWPAIESMARLLVADSAP